MKFLNFDSKFLVSLSIILLSVGLIGCDKPNPNPELLDPIYGDLEKKYKSVESEQKAVEKQLEDFKTALEAVKPQTGQIKFARKRVYDAEALLVKLKQRAEYLKLRIESRKIYVQKGYLAAYKKKDPWPKPSEFLEYKAQQELEEAPKTWNARARLESNQPTQKPPPHGEEKSQGHAAPPAH